MNAAWKRILGLITVLVTVSIIFAGRDGTAGASRPMSELAIHSAALDQTSCNPRDPLAPCLLDPQLGYLAGELFIVDYFFSES
jgi:hypothetical protein